MAYKKILIIDDDARNIFALSAVLKTKGYTCLSATGAVEGLRFLNSNDVGIILLDMMMPEMDGYEVLREMRKSAKAHLPVIAVTAQAMLGDKERCIEAGADGYISKPIDVDVLLHVLDNHLH